MCKNNNCNCISDILKVIFLLQKNADACDDAIESCDRPTLGQISSQYFNTRPVMLYTYQSNGTAPWSAPISRCAAPEALSTVFRVEKVDDCCATFRVLVANDDGSFSSTESFFTMNLEFIACIRCLNDTFVESV